MAQIQSAATPALTSIMAAVSMLGEEMLMVALMSFLFLCYDKKLGRELTAGLVVSLLGGMILKGCFLRRRPYFDHPEIDCLRAPSGRGDVMDIRAQGYSFPSMHAANAAVIAGTMMGRFKKNWAKLLWILLPLVVGFSRVYLGVHYPTDVIAGWVIGALALVVAMFLMRKCSNWLVICLICAILALPGWFICKANDFFSVYGLMAGLFLGFHFEERCVNFKNTRNFWRTLLRLIVAMAIFIGLTKGLKVAFSSPFFKSTDFIAHLTCALRSAIPAFAIMGLYPMLFKCTDRIFNKQKQGAEQ